MTTKGWLILLGAAGAAIAGGAAIGLAIIDTKEKLAKEEAR